MKAEDGTQLALTVMDTTAGRLEFPSSETSCTAYRTLLRVMPPNSSSAAVFQWSASVVSIRFYAILPLRGHNYAFHLVHLTSESLKLRTKCLKRFGFGGNISRDRQLYRQRNPPWALWYQNLGIIFYGNRVVANTAVTGLHCGV